MDKAISKAIEYLRGSGSDLGAPLPTRAQLGALWQQHPLLNRRPAVNQWQELVRLWIQLPR